MSTTLPAVRGAFVTVIIGGLLIVGCILWWQHDRSEVDALRAEVAALRGHVGEPLTARPGSAGATVQAGKPQGPNRGKVLPERVPDSGYKRFKAPAAPSTVKLDVIDISIFENSHVSVEDAANKYTGWIMPEHAGYVARGWITGDMSKVPVMFEHSGGKVFKINELVRSWEIQSDLPSTEVDTIQWWTKRRD